MTPTVSLRLAQPWIMAAPAVLFAAAEQGVTEIPEPTGPEARERARRLVDGVSPTASPEPGAPPPPELARLTQHPPSERVTVGSLTAQSAEVPTTWEREGWPKTLEGPVWFATRVHDADGADGQADPDGRVLLSFGAVSYFCTVWVDGVRVGTHRGLWDPFQLDVTEQVKPGSLIAVEVFKPWSRFPVRESLAGFIPYVTTTFGGPWQPVSLVVERGLSARDFWVHVDAGATVASVTIASDRQRSGVALSIAGDQDEVSRSVSISSGSTFLDVDITALGIPWWSPEKPERARLTVTVSHGDRSDTRTVYAARRIVSVEDTRLLLNGTPIYPRGVLHWMAYPDRFSPSPSRGRVENELRRIRSLGYTMVKLCLVVPPEIYFEVADELGIMLWLELPMWLPRVTSGYAEQAEYEYRRIIRRIRNHPCVILYTLGCELSAEANVKLLERLYALVKEETRGAVVRDNSGSAELYGGVAQEFADFHDYHFYAEANHFTDLMDHFLPAWKQARPLLFGEYCDSDTFRSVAELQECMDYDLYWTRDDPVVNPQGVRWDYHVVQNRNRLAELPIDIPFVEISRRSVDRSFEYRKSILEQTRLHHAPTGYVVTNLEDTPVTTSGMLDDLGNAKFQPELFRRFNSDTVLMVLRDRRRIGRAGGDRRQFLDDYCVTAGETIRLHVVCSHFGADSIGRPQIEYQVSEAGSKRVVEHGFSKPAAHMKPATMAKVADISFVAEPADSFPVEMKLRVTLTDYLAPEAGQVSENVFSYWVIPEFATSSSVSAQSAPRVAVYDPLGEFSEALASAPKRWREHFKALDTVQHPADANDGVLVATVLTDTVIEYAESGARVLLLLQDAADPTTQVPFFREAIALVHDDGPANELLGGLPHHGYAGTMFTAVTPDRALDPAVLAERLGAEPLPVISRLDLRQFLVTHYLSTLDVGTRRRSSRPPPSGETRPNVVATTLRLTGGLGRTPVGFGANVLGRYLFAAGVRFLAGAKWASD